MKHLYDTVFAVNLIVVYALAIVFLATQNMLVMLLAWMLILVVAVPCHSVLLIFDTQPPKKKI